ncbi:DUF6456 domain-containing protein [Ovoidimarina sediminis]|uniref:DUF6456 domain-containing protein n=1 Tax=Ovoidimarina sediminis TaxID=3079856 RepID=UPI002914EF3C|nr:DUF6456 domain-containing protein [Rhodophyticola sp. MJ-SS7]MDU8945012.1 DUF6456 domain-containing protein [Rhodophyticola sp. MJ-SS7]
MTDMNQILRPDPSSEEAMLNEACRVLRRLAEPGACLALAPGMETAVVVRENGEGPALRTAMVAREVAEAMALKDWIKSYGKGRVLRYTITASGRTALRRMVADAETARERALRDPEAAVDRNDPLALSEERRRAVRYSLAESPLMVLARRRDKGGGPFLTPELVAAGERFREDFELALMGDRAGSTLHALLSGASPDTLSSIGGSPATLAAVDRVRMAVVALGPGLSDMALRSLCYLEGMESIEKELSWSARSGKIVLRIALQRLRQHYESDSRAWSPLIG